MLRFKIYVALLLVLTLIGCRWPPPSPPPSVTIEAIENALRAGVDSRSIEIKIRKNGVDFELTEDIKRRLKKAKVDKIVMNAIKDSIKRKNPLLNK